jgi:hypothetical protein
MIFPAIDPTEIIDIAFDFKSEIGSATISGIPVVTVQVENGTDAAASGQIVGIPVVVGAIVYQRRMAGVDGVDYYWRCVATLSDGRKLARGAVIPVRDAGRRATHN